MNSLPAQNTTSISRPIEPIDRALSDAVASIINGVEMVRGQAIAQRLPSPALRQSITRRLEDVRRALLPLGRATVEKQRAAHAVVAMLRGWFNAKSDNPEAKVAGYITILQDLPCWVVERVCQDVATGRVEGLDKAYPPSAAQLHALCEEALERLRKEAADLVTVSGVKLVAHVPSEAERLRIGTRLVDLRDELEHGNADDVEARLLVKAEQNNTELARQQARVAAEYAAIGLKPPSPLALSLTARKAMAAMDQERSGSLSIDIPTDAYQEAGE